MGPVTTPVYDFRITFTKLTIGIARHIHLTINGVKDTIIKSDNLYHQTTPIPTFSKMIIYTLLKVPRFGVLYVDGYPNVAKAGDSFTQQDLDKNLIRYKTYHTCYSSFIDSIEFVVSVPECDNVPGTLNLIFNPNEELAKTLSYQKRDRLPVNEGDRASVTRMHFDVLFNKFNYLTFNVTEKPKHGTLCLYNENFKEPIDFFTLDALYLGDIFYCHDDSESAEDTISIIVDSDDETDFQYVSELLVDVYLQNDNPPYKVPIKKFTIVRDDIKAVTGNDLKYEDPDINTRPSEITYKQVSCSNGEIMLNGYITTKFTQDDLENQQIYFKHFGTDNGNISFVVDDGAFEVPGVLEIEASDPYLKIKEANASVVQEGKMVWITSNDLKIDTNLNVKPEEVEYKIINDPAHGVLKFHRKKLNLTYSGKHGNGTSLQNFTQWDIERERIVYWNTEVASMDKIR